MPDGRVRLAWESAAARVVLESTAALGTTWEAVMEAPVVEGDRLTVLVPPGDTGARFYRLMKP